MTDNQQLNETLNYILQQNIKPVIFLATIIVFAIIFLVIGIIYLVMRGVSGYKELNIGPIKLKNKNAQEENSEGETELKYVDSSNNNNTISVNVFINILDVILSSQLKLVIRNCIDASEKLEKIYKAYDDYVEAEFNRVLLSLKNEYYTVLLNLINEIYAKKGEENSVKKSNEYVFVSSLLDEFEKHWKMVAKEITRRNGFVEFKIDTTRSENYIKDMKNCIFNCIDASKISYTEFDMDTLKAKLTEVNDRFNHNIEVMLLELSDAKIKMFDKRDYQLRKIDEITNSATTNILNGILSKFLNSKKTIEEIRLSSIEE